MEPVKTPQPQIDKKRTKAASLPGTAMMVGRIATGPSMFFRFAGLD